MTDTDLDRFDVAFSLVSDDLDLTEALRARLPDGVNSFLYSKEQRRLKAARDGLDAFPTVFRNAKLCVVMFREKWGNTRWSRLEKHVIADRFMDEGSGFLVLVRLDDSPVPPWFPTTDFWIDLQRESAESAAEYIAGRLAEAGKELVARNASRSLARRPVPLARYQKMTSVIRTETIPWEPEACDACGELVQYRPLLSVSLPQEGTLPATHENLCPKCARQRGLRPMMQHGLSDDVLYADHNPPIRFHYLGRLSAYFPSIRNDPRLRAKGMTDVFGMYAGPTAIVFVNAPLFPKSGRQIPLRPAELEAAGVHDDHTLVDYVRSRIEQELETRQRS